LRHACGAIAYVDVSWRDLGLVTRLEVCGTDGLYQVDGSSQAGFALCVDSSLPASYLPGKALDRMPADDPYRLELEAALAWFEGGPEPRAVLSDGLAALQAVAAAEESIRSGSPVEIEPAA
jgi:predicted dehydrogenase